MRLILDSKSCPIRHQIAARGRCRMAPARCHRSVPVTAAMILSIIEVQDRNWQATESSLRQSRSARGLHQNRHVHHRHVFVFQCWKNRSAWRCGRPFRALGCPIVTYFDSCPLGWCRMDNLAYLAIRPTDRYCSSTGNSRKMNRPCMDFPNERRKSMSCVFRLKPNRILQPCMLG